ncbi:hypothetical protein [Undibacter mobilis]|uniref:hypothetical protein n=1 Tax=Undibacter mobilis TaxID=2292256 RepID=UPI00143DE247|nr:hypothetical protein [Undibacter mobilis]
MDDRWTYPISMTMQRHSGSAPKPRVVPVSPSADPAEAPVDGKAETARATMAPEQ